MAINQGGGRSTRGSRSKAANMRATAAWIENYRRQKRAANRRIMCQDAATGETKELTRFEFDSATRNIAAQLGHKLFENLSRQLKAGKVITLGGNRFWIEQEAA